MSRADRREFSKGPSAPAAASAAAAGPRKAQQLGLFGDEPLEGAAPVAPAPVDEALRRLAAMLPPRLRLGTSSWSFPGWEGLVYGARGKLTPRRLARQGLAAYAQHPLLRAVGLDRSYYTPLLREVYARYGADVPDDFRFLVKAHEALVSSEGACFLDVETALRDFVVPSQEGLGPDKTAALLFQFPPLPLAQLGGRRAFTAKLHAFISALPKGPVYAVEVRNRELWHRELPAALADAGAVPCFNVHPLVPSVAEQRRFCSEIPPVVVVRWMLHAGFRYAAAKARYAPFDRLVDPDPSSRDQIAALVAEAATHGRETTVVANNKAEGSAPLTLRSLAEQLAD
jgi:uncharacterized protein YecE (DUF72 family)